MAQDSARTEDIQFVQPLSSYLKCHLCLDHLKEPQITPECGHTFCKECILRVFGKDQEVSCPLCRTKISLHQLHPNRSVEGLLNEQLIYCSRRKMGCDAIFPLSVLPAHEDVCEFKLSFCPHHHLGCRFEGPMAVLAEHIQNCAFEALAPFITRTSEQIEILKRQIRSQQGVIQRLVSLFPSEQQAELQFSTETPVVSPESTENISPPRVKSPPPQMPLQTGGDGDLNEISQWHSLHCSKTLVGHQRGVTALTYHEGLIYSGSHDCCIRVWNFDCCIRTFTAHKYTIWSLLVFDSWLCSASADGTINVWDLTKILDDNVPDSASSSFFAKQMRGHSSKVYCLALQDVKEQIICSGSADTTIRSWDVKSGICLYVLRGHKAAVWALECHQRLLYSASEDGNVKVWDPFQNTCLKTLPHNNSKTLSLAISSGFLFVGCHNCKIHVWDLATFAHVAVVSEHSWEVWQLSSFRDKFLLSGSFDQNIKVWKIESGGSLQCMKTLEGHNGYIHALCASTDFIISASGDRSVKIWSR